VGVWIWLNIWGTDMNMDSGTFLVDMLSNFPFLGFIIWQYLTAQKDLKEQRSKMENIRKEQMDQIKEMRTEAKEEESQLRNRFEMVIKELNADRDALVTQLEARIQALEQQIRKIFHALEDLKKVKSKVEKIEMKEEIRKEIG